MDPDEVARIAADLKTVGGAYEFVAACFERDHLKVQPDV